MAKLRAENERLRKKLAQAEVIIDVQGKVHALFVGDLDERGARRRVVAVQDIDRRRACEVLGRSRASHYRKRRPPLLGPPAPRPPSNRKITQTEADTMRTRWSQGCQRRPLDVPVSTSGGRSSELILGVVRFGLPA